jgi:hypothetical protein
MFIFFDETFRQSLSDHKRPFGALCGIALPEKNLHSIAHDVYLIKYKHLGAEFAKDSEIKGKDLLKNYVWNLEEKGLQSRNLELARDLLSYIVTKRFYIFGCVCFEKEIQKFKCEDVVALDMTFRYIFERVDMFMKIEHPQKMAKIVFDDRDYGINKVNSEAITNFFQRSIQGISLDSIVKTPFFAISQSQNVGLQLADFVTTIIGLRFSSHPKIKPFFDAVRQRCFYYYQDKGKTISSLKLMRGTE